ncbi:sensor histidine kinase [Actinoplanes couchii]|uniref:histidine kinase n=1 Tax=Actinoplanes couchii TaxID=403638 RepID=A0ABQ3X4H2_9ACTN|nr:histidine kinase [Actinoplanes couchii]MDR6326219.1 signal transduction histidine kinase [Actinoplanes couchii]GID53428.1 histidine kinase [Actinoplanes couchii]
MNDHLAPALKDRRYLFTSWPWRAAGHLATVLLFAVPLAFVFWLTMLPWLIAGQRLIAGNHLGLIVFLFMALGLGLIGTVGPVVALPLAAIARRCLRLIDGRPLAAPRHPANAHPRDILFAESTWRAVLYGVVLSLVTPPLMVLGGALLALQVTLLVSPWLAEWTLGDVVINGGPGSVPFMLLGIVLIPAGLYLAGALAAAHGALSRKLLGNSGDALRNQLGEVAQSRARLADAFDAERRRIERDLHDGAQHRLTSLTLHLGMARLDVPADSPAAAPLTQAHDQAKELMVVLRDLVHGIRPQTLGDLGLPAALWELAASSPVPVAVDAAELLDRLPERIETTAYFVAAEALTNVAKHAHATSVQIRLTRSGHEGLVLEIQDDGRGGADPAHGSGLTGLADRVAAVDGKLLLASPAGGPTLLRVEL